MIAQHIVIEDPVFYLGAGNIVAALLSWKRNKDVLWAAVAFLFGWAYVVYWVFTE